MAANFSTTGLRRRMSSKTGSIGFGVWHEFNPGGSPKRLTTRMRQVKNADLLGAADIEDLAKCCWTMTQAQERLDSVGNVTKAARLKAITNRLLRTDRCGPLQ